MKARAQRALRVQEVQATMRRLEEIRLSEVRLRLADLDVAQKELIAALNEDATLHGLFVDAMSRRLERLAVQAQDCAQEEVTQQGKLLTQAIRAKSAARIAARSHRALGLDNERRRLLDLAEQWGLLTAPASRKVSEI